MSERFCRLHDVRACGVLRHPDSYAWLIVRGPDAGGRWHLPGGRLRHRENPRRTVVREFGEELDVTVRDEPRLRAVSWTEPSNPGTLGKVTFVFDLGFLPPGAQITPAPGEIADWNWTQPDELDSWLHPFDAERAAAIVAEDRQLPISYLEQHRTPAPAAGPRVGMLRTR